MSIAGTWNITLQTPMGAQQMTFIATESGDTLAGTVSQGDAEAIEINNGKLNGNEASWDLSVTKPMALTLGFTGTVDGDKISGTAKLGMFGSSKFEGTRG